MRKNGLSTAYVVDDKMRLQGILTISDALKAHNDNKTIEEVVWRDLAATSPDTLIQDALPLATSSPYPIAVVDDEHRIMGIVTKASVLSSFL